MGCILSRISQNISTIFFFYIYDNYDAYDCQQCPMDLQFCYHLLCPTNIDMFTPKPSIYFHTFLNYTPDITLLTVLLCLSLTDLVLTHL